MTVSQTLRFLLKKYSSGTDPHPNRDEFNAMIDAVENNAAMYSQGPTGSRPAAGKRGRTYWDETAKRTYYDDGAAWQDTNPNGGGGPGTKIVPGAAAAEGVAVKAARADHTHLLDLASGSADGAMPKTDKAKLDAATSSATADAIARRDSGGRISVNSPTSSLHTANKNYVDGQISTLGEDAADYADEAVANAPTATSTTAGKMPAADKAKLDAATWAATPSTVMLRDSSGRVAVGTPSSPGHSATKAYVDTAASDAKTYADAAVNADRPVFTAFTPVWSGFENLGTTGLISSGQYAQIGPNLVRADMRLRAGTGGALGTARISVSLPVAAAGAILQFGSGALLPTGLDGVVRKLEVGTRPGNTTAELWAPATPSEVLKTPGEAGYPFAKNAEIHVSITYQTAAA